jgi:hypothetical protein
MPKASAVLVTAAIVVAVLVVIKSSGMESRLDLRSLFAK